MTNEEAKQEAIKKAYGDNYELCKPDENGWIYHKIIGHGKKTFNHPHNFGYADNRTIIETCLDHSNPGNYKWRLRSISFIEDNNSWIRIEPDGSNLPATSPQLYNVYYDGSLNSFSKKETDFKFPYSCIKIGIMHKQRLITHYKPITPELKPIY